MTDETRQAPAEGASAESVIAEYQVARQALDAVARELGYADGFSGMIAREEVCRHCGNQIKWTMLKQLWQSEEARLMTKLAALKGFNDPKVQAEAEWLTGRIFQLHAFWAEPERMASTANIQEKQKERTFWENKLRQLGDWIIELADRSS